MVVSRVAHKVKNINNDEYIAVLDKWETCKPPYTSAHVRICVTVAKTILLLFTNKLRRSKYEKENYLSIEFNKYGKVTYYAEFPKHTGLKGCKLGHYPEMTFEVRAKKLC